MMDEDRRLRSLRPPKPGVDPWHPIDAVLEEERLADGRRVPAFTVFLAGRECPFTCVFCDLWRHTLDGPTPPGAIPAQLREALARFAPRLTPKTHLKLYNASNFFDDKAVPREDDAEILELVEGFERVVVECHPRLVAARALEYARRLGGRLQVALGLETVHPEALARLNKKVTLADFDRAAATLTSAGAGLRAFVLVGAPFVAPDEALGWTERSVAHAFAQGAEQVSLIPVRGGNGEMERLERQGSFRPPTLEQVEETLDRCLELGPGVVTVDLWDAEQLAACRRCSSARIARLERINASGRREPPIDCPECGGGSGVPPDSRGRLALASPSRQTAAVDPDPGTPLKTLPARNGAWASGGGTPPRSDGTPDPHDPRGRLPRSSLLSGEGSP